ncbi:MAG TPA: DUF3617 family protein [Burkholderiales bacterium]
MRMSLPASALLAFSFSAAAADTGALWEITSQMNMPGMPAGMGARTNRVCQGDDPERQQGKERSDCKVTDKKTTATRTQLTLVCKDGGTMTIDQTYNAARTEFKGVMAMKSSKGDVTINTTGRKVGTCDAVAERKARDAKMDDMKKQVVAGQAAAAASMKDANDRQIKQCSEALEKMDWHGFGMYATCYKKQGDKNCAFMDAQAKNQPGATKACNAGLGEFCKRFQGAEGFMRTKNREDAAKMCGVTIDSIKTAQCPRVAKTQSPLSFLGGYCPVEAKPIAQENCTGRDYTSKMGGKYAAFCQHYLANADFDKPRGGSGSAAAATVPAQDKTAGQKSADAVKEGVSQGVNKLKGLFGR